MPVHNLTGPVRWNGTAIYCFNGPPHRTVEWAITTGGGTLRPLVKHTDAWGRASCRYDAEGYTGPLVIEASYVS